MPSPPSNSPDEGFFNDLARRPSLGATPQDATTNGQLTGDGDGSGATAAESEAHMRTKRIACVLCRKRKLRCDGVRPACGTCKRLTHDCAYDEVRKKSGPKRGYVKLLEARLQQVETLLKSQDTAIEAPRGDVEASLPQSLTVPTRPNPTSTPTPEHISAGIPCIDPQLLPTGAGPPSDPNVLGTGVGSGLESSGEEFSWEMISLGLEEPLPVQDTVNDLHRIYFEKIHPSMPIIHRPRYLAAMNLAPQMRPPIGLRYMIWCMAASVVDKYEAMQEHFYHRARKYLQMDEMKGHGESMITVGICQAWLLVGMYEFKLMFFPRAWMSVGRAARLAQMMGLHRLDGAGLDVKQCIPPPRDWTEREERRRTFWFAFCEDRYASIGTGWPMVVDERDIMTNLPASEEAFDKSKPMPTTSLADGMRPGGAAQLTQLGGVVLMACLFGRNLTHLHRPTQEDQDDNLEGAFWQRHRELERTLANISLSLPDNLRLPAGFPDVNVIFLNMNIHTSTICLHQAAIFKADRHRLPANVGSESRLQCVAAAAEIARTMRMLVHLDLSSMNPFISFCLYVAARVFVQYLKFRPKDQQMSSSLHFLLTAMHALKRKNPLTESFIVQLDLDLISAGIDVGQPKMEHSSKPVIGEVPVNTDSVRCSAIFEMRDSQQPTGPSAKGPADAGGQLPTYGDRGLAAHNDPTESIGGPFHMAHATVDMAGMQAQSGPDGSFAYLDRQGGANTLLPNYSMNVSVGQRVAPGVTAASLSPSINDDVDMTPDQDDRATTPHTDISRQTPNTQSSHTSFSPPDQNEISKATNTFAPGLFPNSGLASTTIGATRAGAVPLGPTTVENVTEQAFFPVSNQEMDFSNMNTGFTPGGSFELGPDSGLNPSMSGEDFALPRGWEISMGGGTGLTPLAEQSGMNWSNIMDGWDGMAAGHQTGVFGQRI